MPPQALLLECVGDFPRHIRLVVLGEHEVGAEKSGWIERAIAMSAINPKALFFLGLAAQQANKPDEARAIWSSLVESAPADDSWAFYARSQIEQLGKAP